MLMFRPLSLYAIFTGRSRRSEYWLFFLFLILGSMVAAAIDAVVTGANLISSLFSLGVLLPSIAVGVRRLHDTDRSGWWMLLMFLPLIGTIWLVVLFCFDSMPGANRFGPNPKG